MKLISNVLITPADWIIEVNHSFSHPWIRVFKDKDTSKSAMIKHIRRTSFSGTISAFSRTV